MENIDQIIKDLVKKDGFDKDARVVTFSEVTPPILDQMPERWRQIIHTSEGGADVVDKIWKAMKEKLPGFISLLQSKVLAVFILTKPACFPALLYVFSSEGEYFGYVGRQPRENLPDVVAGFESNFKDMWCLVHDGWTELNDSSSLLYPLDEWKEIGNKSDTKLTEVFRKGTNTIGVTFFEKSPAVYGIYASEGEVEELGDLEKFWPEIDMWLSASLEEFDNK